MNSHWLRPIDEPPALSAEKIKIRVCTYILLVARQLLAAFRVHDFCILQHVYYARLHAAVHTVNTNPVSRARAATYPSYSHSFRVDPRKSGLFSALSSTARHNARSTAEELYGHVHPTPSIRRIDDRLGGGGSLYKIITTT